MAARGGRSSNVLLEDILKDQLEKIIRLIISKRNLGFLNRISTMLFWRFVIYPYRTDFWQQIKHIMNLLL
ncbi:hypothetical protein QW060_18100 [Myroides ceti]|uniref:Uncharacterized protein n=1 Tax=Paenimyroides ceti TaxID=395087 RepID=A0ABT8CXM8_9FLAO|nr:hypothetical protein [Paenimyroides ceti]MDN3708990.1 hypothetical protein [Paenimyroides ceti]